MSSHSDQVKSLHRAPERRNAEAGVQAAGWQAGRQAGRCRQPLIHYIPLLIMITSSALSGILTDQAAPASGAGHWRRQTRDESRGHMIRRAGRMSSARNNISRICDVSGQRRVLSGAFSWKALADAGNAVRHPTGNSFGRPVEPGRPVGAITSRGLRRCTPCPRRAFACAAAPLSMALITLPDELLVRAAFRPLMRAPLTRQCHIASYLDIKNVRALSLTCSRINDVASDPNLSALTCFPASQGSSSPSPQLA